MSHSPPLTSTLHSPFCTVASVTSRVLSNFVNISRFDLCLCHPYNSFTAPPSRCCLSLAFSCSLACTFTHYLFATCSYSVAPLFATSYHECEIASFCLHVSVCSLHYLSLLDTWRGLSPLLAIVFLCIVAFFGILCRLPAASRKTIRNDDADSPPMSLPSSPIVCPVLAITSLAFPHFVTLCAMCRLRMTSLVHCTLPFLCQRCLPLFIPCYVCSLLFSRLHWFSSPSSCAVMFPFIRLLIRLTSAPRSSCILHLLGCPSVVLLTSIGRWPISLLTPPLPYQLICAAYHSPSVSMPLPTLYLSSFVYCSNSTFFTPHLCHCSPLLLAFATYLSTVLWISFLCFGATAFLLLFCTRLHPPPFPCPSSALFLCPRTAASTSACSACIVSLFFPLIKLTVYP